MQQVQENPLGYKPIVPLIVKFGVPSIIAMLVAALYNVTDQIFIGNVVGMLGNAATSVGTASNFSISQGAKRLFSAA